MSVKSFSYRTVCMLTPRRVRRYADARAPVGGGWGRGGRPGEARPRAADHRSSGRRPVPRRSRTSRPGEAVHRAARPPPAARPSGARPRPHPAGAAHNAPGAAQRGVAAQTPARGGGGGAAKTPAASEPSEAPAAGRPAETGAGKRAAGEENRVAPGNQPPRLLRTAQVTL